MTNNSLFSTFCLFGKSKISRLEKFISMMENVIHLIGIHSTQCLFRKCYQMINKMNVSLRLGLSGGYMHQFECPVLNISVMDFGLANIFFLQRKRVRMTREWMEMLFSRPYYSFRLMWVFRGKCDGFYSFLVFKCYFPTKTSRTFYICVVEKHFSKNCFVFRWRWSSL